jgi:hypothetical protein
MTMKISDRIDFDVQCLKDYFERLFLLAEETANVQPPALDTIEFGPQFATELAKQFVSESVAALIRPDMACNIYSFLEFWLTRLCSFHEDKRRLTLNHKRHQGTI